MEPLSGNNVQSTTCTSMLLTPQDLYVPTLLRLCIWVVLTEFMVQTSVVIALVSSSVSLIPQSRGSCFSCVSKLLIGFLMLCRDCVLRGFLWGLCT